MSILRYKPSLLGWNTFDFTSSGLGPWPWRKCSLSRCGDGTARREEGYSNHQGRGWAGGGPVAPASEGPLFSHLRWRQTLMRAATLHSPWTSTWAESWFGTRVLRVTLSLCLSSRTGGRDGGSNFWLRGRRAALRTARGSGRRGGSGIRRERTPWVLGLHPGREGITAASTEVRTAAGRSGGGASAGGAGPGGAQQRRRSRAPSARPGVGPARLFRGETSSSRRTRRLLARLQRPLRRSLASPHPESLSAPLTWAGPASPGRDRGGWGVGGGGAQAALPVCRGPQVGGARGLGLGQGQGRRRPAEVGFRALCPREVQGHLWGRDPEPPVHKSLSPSALRCVQLSPNLAFTGLWRSEFILETLDFCVNNHFTIVVQQLCKSGQITPLLSRAPKALSSS